MTAITVTIPGEPIPYSRAKTAHFFEAGGGRRTGRMHDVRLADYLTTCRLAALQATQRARLAGIAWPRADVRYAVLVLVVRSTGQRCDVDNLAKSALDGMTGPQGLWLDDHAVDDLRVVRCAPERDAPRLVVMAQTIGTAKPLDDLDWLRSPWAGHVTRG